jgi:nitrogen fixation/metabolism regulation signal transduction histidine kinase
MAGVFRKARLILLIAVGCFFLLFGVHLLIAAYNLDNPFYFIMTFFASNLIILISAALVIGFVIRLFKAGEKGAESVPTKTGKEE